MSTNTDTLKITVCHFSDIPQAD